MPQRTILLPFDGSRTALRAVPYAAAFAKLGEPARVVVFTVMPTRDQPDSVPDLGSRDHWETAVRRTLRPAERRLKSLGVADVVVDTTWGQHDAEEIVQAADRYGASMIVMGTHGRSGLARALLGSVAMGVMHHARVPVVFVPPGSPVREARIRRAVFAVDGSDLALQALPLAQSLAEAGVETIVLQAIPPSTMFVPVAVPGAEGYLPAGVIDAITEAAEAHVREIVSRFPAGKARGEVMLGPPASSITEYAHDNNVDLIVMTTHARGGLGRLVLGSVTDRVVRTAKIPVMVVRPKEN